ncbi:MAG TPA: response regulator [Polyangiaceae bacterium]|nr:response regulator [Polyangiaceae bacterium]
MFSTFRAKLIAIVGVASLAFAVTIGVSTIINERVGAQLGAIQQRFVPKMETGPQLEAQFEQLRRALQDAVTAGDGDALEGTRDQYDALLQRLAAAHAAIDAADAAQLRSAIQEYYRSAYDISRRMIEGETGEELVDAMSAMQARQGRSVLLLKKVAAFDRGELERVFQEAELALATGGRLRLGVGASCLAFVILLSLWLSRGVLQSLAQLRLGLERFGRGQLDQPIAVSSTDELAGVARTANLMAQNLLRLEGERNHEDWLKTALVGFSQELRGELSPEEVGARAVRFIARYIEAPAAALYYADGRRVLRLLGEYGLAPMDPELAAALSFRIGEGLVGQACLQDEITLIQDPPPNYLRIRSGVGEGTASVLVFLPIQHLGSVAGVLELGLFKPWSERTGELLMAMRETLAIAIEVARTRVSLNAMLEESQRQAEALEAQEEELKSTNEELHTQQEELRQTNEELTQQAEQLEAQRRALQEKNRELDQAGQHLTRQAEELKKVSAYKSQFLANMSHELRTPLNSMLLLSSLLADNEGKNLSAKQVEFARTIHSAGKDLLALINQVLDLAKVEAGKQELRIETLSLWHLVEHAQRVFGPLASDKKLEFRVRLDEALPASIESDAQRLQQILNNLLANAIKFTQRGQVSLELRPVAAGERLRRADLDPERSLVICVSDTGVGIAPEHQERIFAPFEQVEAASDRRFGGTGLGLTIARELAQVLGGSLELASSPGRGSTFSCYLPYQAPAASVTRRTPSAPLGAPAEPYPVPPPALEPYLLVVEDDAVFAETVGEVISGQGLSWQRVADGKAALELCQRKPPSGIILDLKLPDLDGWQVMERLRENALTANIPVHCVSAADAAERALAMGAVGYLTKPATRNELTEVVNALAPRAPRQVQRVLVVEPDTEQGHSLVRELSAEKLQVRHVADGQGALAALQKERFACMILDLSLRDMDGLEFLQSIRERCAGDAPSIIIYTARPLSKEEARHLDAYAEAVVLKEGSSSERLLDEVRLFVRRLKGGLAPKRSGDARGLPGNVQLTGKRVLVVDDDMRTVYALSATLRAKGADVVVADTGKAALGVLGRERQVHAVLMDIMMPEMDGYETVRRIRQDLQLTELPVIALTAKAMKGDRDRCLEAGASDYLPKPIDPERLIALLHTRLNGGSPRARESSPAPAGENERRDGA